MKQHAPLVRLLAALVVFSLVYLALFTNAKMESTAMEPAIAAGDYLLVCRASYGVRLPLAGEVARTGRPAREDIVLIEKGRHDAEKIVAVLRIVGLPGEVVSITDKRVSIDGQLLEEGYATFSDDRVYPEALSARDNMAALVVPEDAFFVMADRRDTATDSRFFGTVSRNEIVGRALLVYW